MIFILPFLNTGFVSFNRNGKELKVTSDASFSSISCIFSVFTQPINCRLYADFQFLLELCLNEQMYFDN